jgi:hypothetical protein
MEDRRVRLIQFKEDISMSHLHLVTVGPPKRSQQEMLKDHNQILQNYFDTYIARGLSPTTTEVACGFIKRWFEKDPSLGRHG